MKQTQIYKENTLILILTAVTVVKYLILGSNPGEVNQCSYWIGTDIAWTENDVFCNEISF